jgi:hypothetical protein
MWMRSCPTKPEIDEMLTIAPPPAFCWRDRVLHAQEDALGVDVHHLVPDGHAHGVGAGAADPRVVHQDVELAEGGHGGLHRRLPVGLAGDVDLDEARLTAGLGDVVDDVAPLRLQQVAHDDPGPLLREDHGLAPTHAAGPTGDERNLARQSHGDLLWSRRS